MPELISGGLLSASFIRKLAEQKNNLVNLVNPACPAAPADGIIVLVRVKRRLDNHIKGLMLSCSKIIAKCFTL